MMPYIVNLLKYLSSYSYQQKSVWNVHYGEADLDPEGQQQDK